jgi:hypothetical protein
LENSLVLSGDFQIVDDIVVAPGATMTVAAEAHLAFSGAGLKIQGSLNASGMPGGEILMTSSAPSRERWSGVEILSGATAAMTSCIITNADLGVEAKGAGVSLDDCQLIGNGEGARFENCSVTVDGTGFLLSDGIGLELIGGSGTVADCLVDGNGTVGLRAWNAHDYSLSRSTFSGTLDGHGAEFHASSNAHVDSCSFGYNSANGVLARTSGPRFTSCIFTANGMYGIEAVRMALPRLNWCTVVGNKIGVICGGNAFAILGDDIDPASGYNSIYGNQMAAVANFNTMPTPVYARRNWWGSAPPAGRIFMGYVVYSPWLTAVPNPSLHPSSIALSESEYGLSQNQPNPFNPSTKLTMTVAASGDPVLVAVYDASGRLVRTLHDGPAAAGPHELVWNGEDDRGNRVASGVYFARMIAPDFGAVRKMLLLK